MQTHYKATISKYIFIILLIFKVTLTFVIRLEYRKSINSSGFVFNFWLLQFICYSVIFVTWVKDQFTPLDNLRKVLLFGTYGLVTVQLILSFIADNKCLTIKSLVGAPLNSETDELVYSYGSIDQPENAETQENSKKIEERNERTHLFENLNHEKKSCRELLSPYILRITFIWLTRFYL